MIRWKKAKINELIEYKSGYTWSKDQEENTLSSEDLIRVLTVTNIQKELNDEYKLYLKKVKKKDKLDKKVNKNWIITVTSNGNRDRIGNSIFIDRDMEVLFASFLGAFKPLNENKLTPKYFYYWINRSNVQKRITSISEGTTGLGNMSLRHFKRMEVYYPDKGIQEKIASILSIVDKNIEQTKKTIEKVEKLTKSMMQNLLTGKIKPDGTKRRDDEFYIDEKFGKVPKDWDKGKAKDFFVLQRGYDLPDSQVKNGKYPVVMSNGVNIYHNEYKEIGPGVITGRSGSIGNVNYINSNYWPHNTSLFIKDFKNNFPKFVYYYLQFMHLERLLAGTSVPTLNRNDVHRIKITFPRNNEQRQIAKILDLIINEIKNLDSKILKLQKLKKSLMQNLLTGKIEVK